MPWPRRDSTQSSMLLPPHGSLTTKRWLWPLLTHALSGRWRYLEYDWVAEAGTYVREPSGSTHTLVVPDDATESAHVFFVVDGPMEIVDLEMVVDGDTMWTLYRNALTDAGLVAPHVAG